MIALDRWLISSLMLFALPAAHADQGQDVFTRGGQNPAAMACQGCHALSGAEIAAVSASLAALPAPATPDNRRQQMARSAVQSLALYGDWSREIPGCVQCHGPGGVGVGEHFPPLSHQPAAYLVAQLNAWRDGSRRGDPNQLMAGVAKAMTDQEIKAVADYFAAGQEVKP